MTLQNLLDAASSLESLGIVGLSILYFGGLVFAIFKDWLFTSGRVKEMKDHYEQIISECRSSEEAYKQENSELSREFIRLSDRSHRILTDLITLRMSNLTDKDRRE